MSITGAAEVYGLQSDLARKDAEIERLRAERDRLRACLRHISRVATANADNQQKEPSDG